MKRGVGRNMAKMDDDFPVPRQMDYDLISMVTADAICTRWRMARVCVRVFFLSVSVHNWMHK